MEQRGVDDEQAYRLLRKESMRQRVTVEELAIRLLAAAGPHARGARGLSFWGKPSGLGQGTGTMTDKTDPVVTDTTESSTAPGADRRTVLKGAGAAGIAAATYLRGFSFSNPARAQTGAPIKLGFIEDEIGQPLGLRHPEAARGPARREGDQRGQDAQGGRRHRRRSARRHGQGRRQAARSSARRAPTSTSCRTAGPWTRPISSSRRRPTS